MITSNNSQVLVKIEKEELQQLCTEVKESLASEAEFRNIKQVFGLADLWHIQRSTRYRVRRRTLND
jgi:hypothetical protein